MAYTSAFNYIAAGVGLLAPDSWDRRHALVFELELRGRGDVQMFRVEVPGPEITKASTQDARVTVAIPRSDFNQLATEGTVSDYIEAVENGHIRATGDSNIQKLIAQVVQRHEQRVRTKKVH